MNDHQQLIRAQDDIERLKPFEAFYAAESGENKRLKQLIGELADALESWHSYGLGGVQIDLIQRAREVLK